MSDIDQQFIEYVVKSLVGKPDEVKVERRIDEKGVLLELTVDPEDLGRVIGKRGATAQSLRTLLRALGTKNDARYNLKIVDNGAPHVAGDGGAVAGDDDATTAKAAQPADKPAKAETPAEPVAVEESEEPEESNAPAAEAETSDRIAAAREELADLDDLDI